MASLTPTSERRAEQRLSARALRWREDAVLRPGQPVVVLNITSRAALVESDARLRPGAHTELQLVSGGQRTSIGGRLDRCHVAALEPLRYRALLIFDHRLAVGEVPGDARREN